MRHIILASASPRRRDLLEQLGLTFEILPARNEEVITKTDPEDIVRELACQKAMEVAGIVFEHKEKAGAIVIGADTIVSSNGRIFGKPGDEAEAADMLMQLQGNIHQVYTGVALLWREKNELQSCTFYECTDVEMYPMNEKEIASYVASKEPMDKAGGYGIQGRCAAHIKGITGDYNNVVGLPVGRLWQEMKRLHPQT